VQILKHHMRDVITSAEADPTILARGTAGFSGADLENLVKSVTIRVVLGSPPNVYMFLYSQAAIQASKQGYQEVMLSHFEWAKDRIIMGSERKSAYVDDKNKLMTAYHEVRWQHHI
jgi:ATP-dependent metalloprotease